MQLKPVRTGFRFPSDFYERLIQIETLRIFPGSPPWKIRNLGDNAGVPFERSTGPCGSHSARNNKLSQHTHLHYNRLKIIRDVLALGRNLWSRNVTTQSVRRKGFPYRHLIVWVGFSCVENHIVTKIYKFSRCFLKERCYSLCKRIVLRVCENLIAYNLGSVVCKNLALPIV